VDTRSEELAAESIRRTDVLERLLDLRAPQPIYQELLRDTEVMSPMDGVAVAFSRAAAEQVLQDAARFSAAGLVNLGNVRPMIPLSIDPPAHVTYAKLLDRRIPDYGLRPGIELHYPPGLRTVENLELVWPAGPD